jgi:hypothetical protein
MVCGAPELPQIDLIALAERVGTALKTIVENTPSEIANLYGRIKEAPDQKLVVKKKEMLGGIEDVTLTMEKTGENAQAVTVCALKISAKGTFVSDLQWAVWVEMTRELMWSVLGSVMWPARWFAMRAARKVSDAAVEKAVEEGIAKACEKFKENPPAAAKETAPAGGKVEVKAKEGGSGQVAPADKYEEKPAA